MDKDLIEYEANFSVLDRYGTEVTKEEFITDPAIGRDQQIKDLILVLLTPEKSAILIGKPGIGKTAIVEGLAYRIQKNDVPEALQGYTIINIKTASLLGTLPSGESKVQKMIDELKTKDRMILFIDEVHMLIGSTETSSVDFANIFKEGLGRGSIKVIGATTTEEYEKYILRDKAFTRRFQKIEVPEPTREETIKIMMGTLPKFEKQTGRKMKYTSFIQERIMSFIVDITSEYKRIYSLGSRYPDVCLTLLKQAFSYTVYDNRPYMDIFDVRKAIENSKNIYPDVIKKELPNFDNLFNDIMLEEKGEKPVEEWRKDGTLSRKELEENSVQNNSKDDNLSTIADVPEFVDKLELRDSKPVNNIITSSGKARYAKVGSTAVSTGIKEKINKTSNSKVLDDLLLSSDMNVLKAQEPSGRVISNYTVTEEIMPGVDDNYLLQRPIMSNIEQDVQLQEEDAYRYRGNQRRRNEGKRMWNNDYRPERQDISSQNFDKYQNFFHPENDMNNQENEKRMDLLMGRNNNQGPMPNNGYDPMMNQMPPMQGAMQGPMGPVPNNGMYNPMMNQMPPMQAPMQQPMQGPMGPMPNNGYDPMMNQMPPMQAPMQQPMYNQDNMNNGFLNMPDNSQNVSNDNNSFFGTPKPELTTVSDKETIFGAPMYSDNKPAPELSLDTSIDTSDINGNILADNMSLKNGEIVNEFPTFEKLNNLSNITISQTDDNNQESGVGNINLMGPQPMPNNFGMMNPQPMPNNFGMMNPQPMPNNYNMMPNQQMPMNNNRNWTFINGQQNTQQPMTNNSVSSFFQKNILDEAKKKQNTNETNNITSPTNNKDYYEDMKSGEFVNFSDLNSGKVKEEDTNKYMGVQVEENKPQFDLNLESNTEEDNKFDDFYE